MFSKVGPLGLPKAVDSSRPEVASLVHNVRALMERPSFVLAVLHAIEPMVRRYEPLARLAC